MTTQEPDPPDVQLAVIATVRLLRDVHERLTATSDADLRGRVGALRDVLIRLGAHLQREALEEDQP